MPTYYTDLLPSTTGLNLGNSPNNQRWNAILQHLDMTGTVQSNVLPDATGRDLGSAAARFDAFIRDLDISGTVTGLSGFVATTRTISTTSPLSGGGDLSANRTIALANQSANQVLAGPTSGGAAAPAFRALVTADIPVRTIGIPFIIDGGGSAITTGQKGHLEIPFACTITGWTILADQAGSCVIDLWKDSYANFPPTVADTIAGTEKPTLAAVQKNQDLTLSTWTTAVTAGDILAYNVDSASTVQRVLVALRATIP